MYSAVTGIGASDGVFVVVVLLAVENENELTLFVVSIVADVLSVAGCLVVVCVVGNVVNGFETIVIVVNFVVLFFSYVFSLSICSLIPDYFSNRCFCAMVDGSVSPPQTVNSGVLQGCVLSPKLFHFH